MLRKETNYLTSDMAFSIPLVPKKLKIILLDASIV